MFIHVTLDTVPLLLSGPHKLAGGLGFLDLNERNGPQIGEPQRPDPDRLNSTFIAVRRHRRVMDLMENQGDPQLVYALSVRVAFDDYRVSVV